MGMTFFVLQAVAIFFAVVYCLQRLFSRRRSSGGRASGLFTLAFFLGLLVAVFFPNDVRRFSIDHFKNKVVSVDGPNTFTLKVGGKVRLVLSGTVPPAGEAEAQKAEQFLRDRLLGKKVAVDFPTKDKKRPWPAVVTLDKADLSETMISAGLLQRDAIAAPPAAATPAAAVPDAPKASSPPAAAKPKRPPSARFFLWFIAGCIGAAFFSRALLGRKIGLDLFLAFVLLAVRDVALAVRADLSLAPPLIALALALIAGPGMRSADFWAAFKERLR